MAKKEAKNDGTGYLLFDDVPPHSAQYKKYRGSQEFVGSV